MLEKELKYTTKQIWNKVKELGYTPRLVSPNRIGENQYYDCKLGEENPNIWRIDGTKGQYNISTFMDGTANPSFSIPINKFAEKVGVELCNEYSIDFSIYGDGQFFSIDIFKNVKILKEFEKDCKRRFKEFANLCKAAVKE